MYRFITKSANRIFDCFTTATHSVESWGGRFFSSDASRQQRGSKTPQPSYQVYEPRRLLAGIDFTAATGEVLIGGTNGVDVASVTQSGSTITVSHQGFGTQTFTASEVESILFVGLGGDDFFENTTAIPSIAFGQNGNDTLIGGSGIDRLFGNGGDDTIQANGGDDFVVAGIGNDNLDAGAGNDRVLGVNGNNLLEGGEGDDLIFGGNDIDVITDVSGNNTLAGNGGDDTISGGSGADLIFGGPGNDFLRGFGGDDFIYAQAGDDFASGGSGVDVVAGNDGNDTLQGEQGNDRIVGGNGSDTANFSGALADYDAFASGPNLRLNDLRGPNFGLNDLLIGIEQVSLGDGVRTPQEVLNPPTTPNVPSGNIREVITVQPIIASNSDGSNTAEFFGNAAQEADIKRRIDEIFATANVDIEFLPARRVNDTSINLGSNTSGTRAGSDLNQIVSNGDARGLGSPDRNVIDLYFVEQVPGFAQVGESVANGLAFVGSSGIAIQIGDNLPETAGGRNVIAEVTAHEIGHNLGLQHLEVDGNLLAPGGFGDGGSDLNNDQVTMILNSPLSV